MQKGTVKYANYKTKDKPTFKGMRNNRSAIMRKKKEAAARKARRDERKKEDLERNRYRRAYR